MTMPGGPVRVFDGVVVPDAGEDGQPRYFNLTAAIAKAAESGKTYDDDVVRAARALVFKLGYDPMPERWLQILAHQKRTLEDIAAGRDLGRTVKADEVAKPTVKRRRP